MNRYNIDGFFNALDNVYYWRIFDRHSQDYVGGIYNDEDKAEEDLDFLADGNSLELTPS